MPLLLNGYYLKVPKKTIVTLEIESKTGIRKSTTTG